MVMRLPPSSALFFFASGGTPLDLAMLLNVPLGRVVDGEEARSPLFGGHQLPEIKAVFSCNSARYMAVRLSGWVARLANMSPAMPPRAASCGWPGRR